MAASRRGAVAQRARSAASASPAAAVHCPATRSAHWAQARRGASVDDKDGNSMAGRHLEHTAREQV